MGLLAPNPRQNRMFCTQFTKETFALQPLLSQLDCKKTGRAVPEMGSCPFVFLKRRMKMLKLNASYSKKIPAESDYSTQSYHASIEVELPDGLNSSQLHEKIHETFDLVRNSVESELNGNTPVNPRENAPQNGPKNGSQGYPPAGQKNTDGPASPKQIKFLLDLARTNGVTPEQIKARYRVNSLEELTRTQCSKAIDELSGKAA